MIRTLLALSVLSLLGACTSTAQINNARNKADRNNASAKITCYSGGDIIFDGQSKGKVISEAESDGYVFIDISTGKLVEISGDCRIQY